MMKNALYFVFATTLIISIYGQTCGNDLKFVKDTQTYFTIFENRTCYCQNYSGDGSQLTGLENQAYIASLQQTIVGNVVLRAEDTSSSAVSAGWTSIPYNQILVNTHPGSYSTANGNYIFPLDGTYTVSATLQSNIGLNQQFIGAICVTIGTVCGIADHANSTCVTYNGVTSSNWNGYQSFAVSTSLTVNANDNMLVCFQVLADASKQRSGSTQYNKLSIVRTGF